MNLHAWMSGRCWVWVVLAGLVLSAGGSVRAQGEPAGDASESRETEDEPGYPSPQAAMLGFLDAMQRVGEGQAGAIQDAYLSMRLPAGQDAGVKQSYASDLLYVLNRVGPVLDEQFRPGDGAGTEFVYFPRPRRASWHEDLAALAPGLRVVLSDEGDGWRFSTKTVSDAPVLRRALSGVAARGGHDLTLTLGDRVRAMVPSQLKGNGHTVLTLEYWEWMAILAVVLLGMTLDLIVRFVLTVWWHAFERKRGQEVDAEVLKRAVRPFGMVAAALLWQALLTRGLIAPSATGVLLVATRVFLAFGSIWAAFKLTDLVADWASKQATRSDTKFDDLLVPLLQRSVKVFIAALGLVYVANAFSVEIMPLLTGLGIGGLAVAFAAKDTIENFFGSVAVILDRPFEIGDWVVVNDVEGTVEDLGFRSTRIRTFYNSLVTMPNASLVRAQVDNYGRRRYRRFKTVINLTYGTPPDRLDAFCAGVRELVAQHPYTRKDSYHVWVNGLGAHSIDVLVYIFFECPDWAIELRERHRFILDVIRLADRVGVEFAFPTQTLVLERGGGEAGGMLGDPPGPEDEHRACRSGVMAARDLTRGQHWKQQRPGAVSYRESYDDEIEVRGDG